MPDIINAVVQSVGNYRNHKTELLNDTPIYLKSYIQQYFIKADAHFERLMDICINIPSHITVDMIDTNFITLNHSEVKYNLSLTHDLTDIQMHESEFVLELLKRIRSV